jgi:hypothetical protein
MLQLQTGESGAFDFTWPTGTMQRLRIRCLDAVQFGHTDDYWNWDFWAAVESVAPSEGRAGD